MTERQRTSRPTANDNNVEPAGDSNLGDMREFADQLMADAQAHLRRLGLGNANEYVHATRQSGGQ